FRHPEPVSITSHRLADRRIQIQSSLDPYDDNNRNLFAALNNAPIIISDASGTLISSCGFAAGQAYWTPTVITISLAGSACSCRYESIDPPCLGSCTEEVLWVFRGPCTSCHTTPSVENVPGA